VTVRRLNRCELIEIRWLSSIENFVSERDDFICNSFRNFKPVKRFQNRSDYFLEPGQQFEQEHSGCVGNDLFEISEDYSRESYSSQAWSVRWRWQLCWRCDGQGRDGYSQEHECDDSRIYTMQISDRKRKDVRQI